MNPVYIEARDLPEAFWKCCREVLKVGRVYTIDKGSFEGTRRLEFDYITLHVTNPGMRPLAPDVPKGIPSPTNMQKIEDYWQAYLVNPTKAENELYTYGEYLYPQIPIVIERYRRDGANCNQLTMTVGDTNSMNQPDPPCLRMIDTRISNGKLHFIVYFRSWDLWAGFPQNLGGIQLLKEWMADSIGVDDGELIASSKGLHLYEYCWEFAKQYTGIDR